MICAFTDGKKESERAAQEQQSRLHKRDRSCGSNQIKTNACIHSSTNPDDSAFSDCLRATPCTMHSNFSLPRQWRVILCRTRSSLCVRTFKKYAECMHCRLVCAVTQCGGMQSDKITPSSSYLRQDRGKTQSTPSTRSRHSSANTYESVSWLLLCISWDFSIGYSRASGGLQSQSNLASRSSTCLTSSSSCWPPTLQNTCRGRSKPFPLPQPILSINLNPIFSNKRSKSPPGLICSPFILPFIPASRFLAVEYDFHSCLSKNNNPPGRRVDERRAKNRVRPESDCWMWIHLVMDNTSMVEYWRLSRLVRWERGWRE